MVKLYCRVHSWKKILQTFVAISIDICSLPMSPHRHHVHLTRCRLSLVKPFTRNRSGWKTCFGHREIHLLTIKRHPQKLIWKPKTTFWVERDLPMELFDAKDSPIFFQQTKHVFLRVLWLPMVFWDLEMTSIQRDACIWRPPCTIVLQLKGRGRQKPKNTLVLSGVIGSCPTL